MIRPVDFSVLRLGRLAQNTLPPVGNRVQAKVLKLFPGNRVLLRLGNSTLTAKATVRLRPGQLLSATVGRSGTTTILRIDPPSIQTTLFHQSGVPDDNASHLLFRAMVRAGVPLDPQIIRRLRAQIAEGHRLTEEAARLLVEAHRKGIALPATAIRGLSDESGGFSDETPENSDSRSREEQKGSGDSGRPPGSDQSPSKATSKGGEPAGLIPEVVQLFNHVGTAQDDWVVLPLSFDERTEWKGSARIRFDRSGGWKEAAIRIDIGEDPAWAYISRTAAGVDLFMPHSSSPQDQERLRRALEGLGFGNLVVHTSGGQFDGFSTGYSPDIIRPIDEEA